MFKIIIPVFICAVFQICVVWAQESSDRELFQQLDQNRDGLVTKSEISEPQLVYYERLLRKSDSNKDGKLSLTEMNLGLQEPAASNNLEAAGGTGPGGRPNLNPGQMFEFMDRNKDGKLARSELPEMARERMGRIYDFLGKEELTRDEFMKVAGMAAGPTPDTPQSPEMLTTMLKRLDQNNDGKVTPAEVPERAKPIFAQVQRRLGKGENEAVSIKDAESNPLVKSELKKPGRPNSSDQDGEMEMKMDSKKSTSSSSSSSSSTSSTKNSDSKADSMFRQLDKNSNGSISTDEAPEKMRQVFDRIDANNDGKLSSSEVTKAREQREKNNK